MVGDDEKVTSKSNVDIARLPSWRSALKPHVWRVNHRVALYKRAEERILEKPNPYDDGKGWLRTDDVVLGLAWSCGPVLTKALDNDDRDDDDLDFDDFSESNGE